MGKKLPDVPEIDPDDRLQLLNLLWAIESGLLSFLQSVREWGTIISEQSDREWKTLFSEKKRKKPSRKQQIKDQEIKQQIIAEARQFAHRIGLFENPPHRPLEYTDERKELFRLMRSDLKRKLQNLQRVYNRYTKRGLSEREVVERLINQRLPAALLFSEHGLLEKAMTGKRSHAQVVYDYFERLTGTPAANFKHYLKPSHKKSTKRKVV